MAGSINLSLSQQFDKLNGNLLSGGRLYFYAAGTDAPQNAFKDTGLTLVHPNPIILPSDGRVPQLYFADGSIHVRLTDSGGVVQFDEDFVLVIGPSSGGGGGGGSSVDPNAIFQTGDVLWLPVSGGRSGRVIANGTSIGPIGSPASQLASATTLALYTHLWGTYDISVCPMNPPGAHGANANADWAAGRAIATLDFREIIAGGLSSMGNTDLGNFANIPHERGDQNTPAGIVGEIVHLLTVTDVPSHSHTGPTDGDNVGHTHQVTTIPFTDGKVSGSSAGGPSGNIGNPQSATTSGGESNPHSHSFTTTSFGGGFPHNTTPRTMLGTFYMRL